MKSYLPIIATMYLVQPAFAQRDAKIPDPDPEIERKSFIVAPGFEVNLFAADPLLAKPIQMNWDPQGRLWVATSETYPQILPGQKANDKIIILEDTNHDGTADKTTVFADGLLIPTGIEPGDGGAYVANSTELVHLSASKPGGKADRKKVLLSGFGTEDTHHIIHTFRWGPDGCLYFNQSIYIHSHVETPSGVKRLNAGGIWRYNTSTNDLSVFARGWINAWGHAFDKYGQSFVTDGAGGEGINHVVPGAYYATAQGPHASRILHGLNPGSPKYCGLEIVSGRHFPDDWQGNLITNDFRGHRVCRFALSEDGSTYSSREMPELIKSNHPAFRPIDVKMGPDGAIYIADWYNPIIQHGEVDFRDPRRDKTHGRIWRVTAKNRPLVPKPKLVGATVPELLEKLKEPEDWTRAQARRVLQESIQKNEMTNRQISDAMPMIDSLSTMEKLFTLWLFSKSNNPSTFRDALASLHSIEGFVKSNSAQERAMAIRFGHSHNGKIIGLDGLIMKDVPALVRLELVRFATKLADVRPDPADRPKTHPAEFALQALDHPMDPTLDYALWLTLRELEPVWLPAFQKGELTFGGDPKKIAFALSAAQSPDAVKPLAKLLAGGTMPKDKEQELYLVLARIGGPEELAIVLNRASSNALSADDRRSLVRAVEQSVVSRKVRPPSDLSALDSLIKAEEQTIKQSAMKVVGHWKLSKFRESLEGLASAGEPEVQPAAIEAIAAFADDKAKATLTNLAESNQLSTNRVHAIVNLATLDLNAAAKSAASYMTQAKSGTREGVPEIVAAFAGRRGGGTALANALKGKELSADTAKIALARIRTTGANEPALVAALTAAGKLNAVKAYPTEATVKLLATGAVMKGDAARGEAIYRRADMQCLKCHAIAGAGGQVGPDLSSLGASAQPDYIVEALLNPNAKVKEGFNAIQVTTLSGKVVQGVKVREADGVLVLRNAEDKEESIRLDDIDSRKDSRSLMADGLCDPLPTQDLMDLTRFLSELGKVGPFAPNPARIVRKWEYVPGTGTNTERMRRTRIAVAAEKENGLAWLPMYSKVSGDLPLAELPKYSVWQNTEPQSVIRCHLDVTAAGKVGFTLNDASGLTVFVDGKPVTPKAEFEAAVPVGQVAVTMIVDRLKRTSDIKLELTDVPGSLARVKVVGGK
jgi:putative heme-binding domain-containing protein